MSRRLIGAGLLTGVLFSGAVVSTDARARRRSGPTISGDTVTLTIGLLQDLSSPNVTVGLPRARLTRSGTSSTRRSPTKPPTTSRPPRPRRVVGGVERRPHLHLHAARGPAVVRRRAADRRRHRVHGQPVARRGVEQPLLDGRQNLDAVVIDERTVEITVVGARPEAADDGRLHRARAHLRGDLRRRPRVVRRPRRRRIRPVLAHRVALRTGLDDGEEPQLVRRRQRHRPHRVPGVHQRRRDGRRTPGRRDRRRPRASTLGARTAPRRREHRDRVGRAGIVHRAGDERRRRWARRRPPSAPGSRGPPRHRSRASTATCCSNGWRSAPDRSAR